MMDSQYDELLAMQNSHWWFVGKREIICDYGEHHTRLHIGGSDDICDIGCGMGLMLDRLSKYGKVFGLDMEPSAVAHCREAVPAATVEIGRLPDQIPFPDQSFDVVVASDVLEHVKDDVDAARCIANLLRPDGNAIVTVPAHMSLWSHNDELNCHFRRYERDGLVSVLTAGGLVVRHISFYNSRLLPAVRAVRALKTRFGDESSDVDTGPSDGMANDVLRRIFEGERRRLRHGSYRNGVSLICCCEKA